MIDFDDSQLNFICDDEIVEAEIGKKLFAFAKFARWMLERNKMGGAFDGWEKDWTWPILKK